jgi:hypothetical protein
MNFDEDKITESLIEISSEDTQNSTKNILYKKPGLSTFNKIDVKICKKPWVKFNAPATINTVNKEMIKEPKYQKVAYNELQLSPWDTGSNIISQHEKDLRAYKTPKYQPKQLNITSKAKESIMKNMKLFMKDKTGNNINLYIIW